jgi:phosphorylase kinase alpha/beta subunit
MDRNNLASLLDIHYNSVESIILSKQNPITGLLPASTAINSHGDYTDAWVRDNVYSILSVWGLSLAYKKYIPDHHRTFILKKSVVKLMRGLLTSMMRQSHKLEKFKNTLNPEDALHAKYGTDTGLSVVGDHDWGHLQLDATSLYLLMLAQMIASGLRIIYTIDEVNFIQNLVHYISKTYCTADYGIWERGNKINHGEPEINCSSVGMAKAALEALKGFNLFGNVLSHEAVIHVIPNDIARSRFTLHGLLPRESNSKETDAALLSIIGYPAYAVESNELVQQTRDQIIKKLCGEYGCKRFLLDGHQSVLEDPDRLHYEPSELKEFEHTESQWPLFYTYLLLDAIMRNDHKKITYWREKLENTFIEQDGEKLLPELYFIPKESIEAEKQNPNSQKRIPNENIPLVWAQSLYQLSQMILDGILLPSEIDPLKRREKLGLFKQTYPLVSILSQNKKVKQTLLDNGIDSQSINEVEPIKIMYSNELSRVHTLLGANKKLGLSGRPYAEARTITTSSVHLVDGQKIIFLPYYFNPKGFYFSYDNKLLVDHFRSSLKFLSLHWDSKGQPLIVFLVREDMLNDQDKTDILELLHQLQNSGFEDLSLKTGSLDQLLNTAAIEPIDYLHGIKIDAMISTDNSMGYQQIEQHNEYGYQINSQNLYELDSMDDMSLLELVITHKNRLKSAIALIKLYERTKDCYTLDVDGKQFNLCQIAEEQYITATLSHDWAVVRRVAQLTNKYDDKLEDALLEIIIRQKQLAVGRAYNEHATLTQPLDSHSIVKVITDHCGENTAEKILTQEIILHLGHLIRNEPQLFKTTLTLRTWYYVQLMVSQICMEHSLSIADGYEYLISLSPHNIYNTLKEIMLSFNEKTAQLKHQEKLQSYGLKSIDKLKTKSMLTENAEIEDWKQWRQEAGMLGHSTDKLHKKVWYILQQCNGVVIGDKYDLNTRIGSELTHESTANERKFEILIDTQLHKINAPEYRQLNIELIETLHRVLKENHTIYIEDDLIFDVIIGYAVKIVWCEDKEICHYDEEKAKAWEYFYKLSTKKVEVAFFKALKYLLLKELI